MKDIVLNLRGRLEVEVSFNGEFGDIAKR